MKRRPTTPTVQECQPSWLAILGTEPYALPRPHRFCCHPATDNAGVFAAGGMAPFLAYVRNDPKYKSSFIESTLEWRDDVKDGIEVAFYNMPADEAAASLPSTAAKSAEAAKAPSS